MASGLLGKSILKKTIVILFIISFPRVLFGQSNATKNSKGSAQSNFQKMSLTGIYNNNSADTVHYRKTTFWSHLKPFPNDANHNRTANEEIKDSYLGIQLLEDNQIQFDLYDKDRIINTKTYTYQSADTCIYIKSHKNKVLKGIPGLFFSLHRETIYLQTDKQSNLILTYKGVATGGPFILIFGTTLIGSRTFVRKK